MAHYIFNRLEVDMANILSKMFFCVGPAVLLLGACQSAPPKASAPITQAATPAAMQGIRDVDWKLVQLDGQPVGIINGKPLTLRLTVADNRVTGFAGCNTFSGGFSQTSDRLTFTPLAMTRMACAEGQLTENKYAVVLTGARTYRWTARSLELLDGTTVLARFERM